jgi:hypothetical protein
MCPGVDRPILLRPAAGQAGCRPGRLDPRPDASGRRAVCCGCRRPSARATAISCGRVAGRSAACRCGRRLAALMHGRRGLDVIDDRSMSTPSRAQTTARAELANLGQRRRFDWPADADARLSERWRAVALAVPQVRPPPMRRWRPNLQQCGRPAAAVPGYEPGRTAPLRYEQQRLNVQSELEQCAPSRRRGDTGIGSGGSVVPSCLINL